MGLTIKQCKVGLRVRIAHPDDDMINELGASARGMKGTIAEVDDDLVALEELIDEDFGLYPHELELDKPKRSFIYRDGEIVEL